MTTVTFTNSDISNAIVLTVVNANSPIIDVTIDSGHPYTTQALDLNKRYLLQLHKGVVKSFFLIVTSNPFSCDLNDLFNSTPTESNVTFTNSDPSNAITLSVQDDQGNIVVDDVSVTNSNPYVDTLKLNATYSVHLKKEGASDQDISLTITSNPFTYDICTPFLNNAIVVFTNSDKSKSITLSVLDDEGVSVIKDVIVSPGNKPHIATLQLEETYKLLLVKGTVQEELSVTISSNPFSYEINTPFYAQVTFTNSDQNAISLSVPDGKGGYLIQDVNVTESQPYVTDILDLNQTYTLKLTKGIESTQLPVEISYNGYTANVNTSFEGPVNVTFTNTNPLRHPFPYIIVSLSVLDGQGGYHIKDALINSTQPYATRILNLNSTYSLELKVVEYGLIAQPSITINSNSFTYDVYTPFLAQVTFSNSNPVYTRGVDAWDSLNRLIIYRLGVSYGRPYTTNYLTLNVTYTLEVYDLPETETRRTTIRATNGLNYDVNAAYNESSDQ